MKSQEKFAEGRTKTLFKTDQEDHLIMEFLDRLPFEGEKKLSVKGKGAMNSQIAAYLFEYLQSYNVPSHFLKRLDEKSILVKKLNMIPMQLMIWNIAMDGLSKRLGISDGTVLETPVLEFYLKDNKLRNPMINDYHAFALGICDRSEITAVVRIGTKVNAVLRSLFQRKNLSLTRFTLEFGKTGNQVMLGDEITPDTFQVWAIGDSGKMDRKLFAITPESAKQNYSKIHQLLVK